MAAMRLFHTRKGGEKPCLVVSVAVLFFWQQSVNLLLSQTTDKEPGNAPQLKIVVLAGEDGVNIIKKKTAVKPVVEVRDKNNQPVSGLSVTFLAPESGPHVAFAHGSSTFTTVTDASGRATVHIMKPIGQGAFKIGVRASLQGHIATATIAQTNYLTVGAATAAGAGGAAGAGTAAGASAGAGAAAGAGTAAAAGISGTMIGVIVGAVAAGAVVAVAASKSGGGSKTGSTTPTGTVGTPGTPSLGPP
jgi:hypothetical protein